MAAFAVVVCAQVIYHLAQKGMPTTVHPFAVLTLVYALSTAACLGTLLLSDVVAWPALRASMVTPTWVLAVAVVGIEVGFLFLYRNGGALSSAYAISGAATVVILFLIAALWIREPISGKQLTGVALAATGIWLATTGR